MTEDLTGTVSTSSLGFRLGATLVVALLPLGLLSIVQTKANQAQVTDATLNGVAGASVAAVQPQVKLIRSAQTTARVLAATLTAQLPEGADCVRMMMAAREAIPEATLVAFVPMSGLMTCASNGKTFDFAGNPQFARITARAEPALIYNPRGPVSGTAIVAAGHPVFAGRGGAQVGVVTISLPYTSVEPAEYVDELTRWHPTELVSFTDQGEVLVTSNDHDLPDRLLPKGDDWRTIGRLVGRPEFFRGEEGNWKILSVTPLTEGLSLLSMWEQDGSGRWLAASLSPYVLPVLTWGVALLAAAVASGRLVVRHVRELASAMSAFRAGRKRESVRHIKDAPLELRQLNDVYEEMVRTIDADDRKMQDLLAEKDALLKEVNHRSGNSLQIIASIMRMYRRESADPAVREVLDGLIMRVMALSSTHTSLYSLAGQDQVPMDEILASVTRRLKDIHGIEAGSARKSFDPIRMPSETAIPLALALAEVLSAHFSLTYKQPVPLDIALKDLGPEVRLRVVGPVVQEFLPETMTGPKALPQRMLAHYAAQVGGRRNIRIEGAHSVVELIVPRRPEAPAKLP